MEAAWKLPGSCMVSDTLKCTSAFTYACVAVLARRMAARPVKFLRSGPIMGWGAGGRAIAPAAVCCVRANRGHRKRACTSSPRATAWTRISERVPTKNHTCEVIFRKQRVRYAGSKAGQGEKAGTGG